MRGSTLNKKEREKEKEDQFSKKKSQSRRLLLLWWFWRPPPSRKKKKHAQTHLWHWTGKKASLNIEKKQLFLGMEGRLSWNCQKLFERESGKIGYQETIGALSCCVSWMGFLRLYYYVLFPLLFFFFFLKREELVCRASRSCCVVYT